MGAFLKKYIWLWEMIATAIAIACAIIIVTVQPVLYIVIGIILAVLGLFRIVPLVKTTDDKVLKWMNAIELIINILIGVSLIFFGFTVNNGNEDLKNFIDKNFGYFVGVIFYLRGLVYFYTCVIKKEDSNYPLFIIHIVLFTLGTAIIVLTIQGEVNYDTIKWFLFGLTLIASAFTGYSGIKGYINYRGNEQNEKAMKKLKDIKINQDKTMEAPTDAQIQDEIINQIKINPDVQEDKNTVNL